MFYHSEILPNGTLPPDQFLDPQHNFPFETRYMVYQFEMRRSMSNDVVSMAVFNLRWRAL